MQQVSFNSTRPSSQQALAVIPARYGSTRFPGKPLAKIAGRPMIEYVYNTAVKAVGEAVVATDDRRIYDIVIDFGGRAVMTSESCPNGTARVAEAVSKLNFTVTPAYILNVQGDEPMVTHEQLTSVLEALEQAPGADVGTLALRVSRSESYASLADPNRVKMVLADGDEAVHARRALYFSRSVIPFVRDCEPSRWAAETQYYIHIGIYAFRTDNLATLISLPPSPIDMAERLEQLRWLAHGCQIVAAITDTPTHAVDTPADLEKINAMMH